MDTFHDKLFDMFDKVQSLSQSVEANAITYAPISHTHNVSDITDLESTLKTGDTDITTWKQTTLPSTNTWTSIAYGNGKFVAIAYGANSVQLIEGTNSFAYSDDGVNWTEITSENIDGDSSCNWQTIYFGGGKFIATHNSSDAYV